MPFCSVEAAEPVRKLWGEGQGGTLSGEGDAKRFELRTHPGRETAVNLIQALGLGHLSLHGLETGLKAGFQLVNLAIDFVLQRRDR